MENNLSDKYLNRKFIKHTLLSNFFSDNPEEDVEKVKLFISDQDPGKVLIIRGEPGNGKAHLLGGLASELFMNNIKIALLVKNQVINFTKNDIIGFKQYLQDCKFCLFDHLDSMIDYSGTFNWLKIVITDFINNGGKFVFSTCKDITQKDCLKYFKTTSIIEVNTSYPTLKTLKLIGKQCIATNIVDKYANEAFSKSSSIRDG